MDYHIKLDKTIIASFVQERDRNLCLIALMDHYPDCKFIAITRRIS